MSDDVDYEAIRRKAKAEQEVRRWHPPEIYPHHDVVAVSHVAMECRLRWPARCYQADCLGCEHFHTPS